MRFARPYSIPSFNWSSALLEFPPGRQLENGKDLLMAALLFQQHVKVGQGPGVAGKVSCCTAKYFFRLIKSLVRNQGRGEVHPGRGCPRV